MSIEVIDGDLLDFPNQINTIAHSCNTQNVMGAGIAKSIKERYPEAFKAVGSSRALRGASAIGRFGVQGALLATGVAILAGIRSMVKSSDDTAKNTKGRGLPNFITSTVTDPLRG